MLHTIEERPTTLCVRWYLIALGVDFGAKAIKVAALLSAATPNADLQITKANSLDGRDHKSLTDTLWSRFLSKTGKASNERAQKWGD